MQMEIVCGIVFIYAQLWAGHRFVLDAIVFVRVAVFVFVNIRFVAVVGY